MNIVLIGYRGCGKTTVGKALAEQLWSRFVDTDDLVCARFRETSIKRIWELYGEPEYRRVECEVVAETMAKSGQVVGLGGGTLMEGPARDAVENAKDTVRIYLWCEPDVLYDRIQNDTRSAATRPNLTALGGGVDEIKTMLEERGPVYKAVADHTFDVSRMTPEDAVGHIVRLCL